MNNHENHVSDEKKCMREEEQLKFGAANKLHGEEPKHAADSEEKKPLENETIAHKSWHLLSAQVLWPQAAGWPWT
jgi:hypothetical protein